MSDRMLLCRLAEEERDRAALLRLDADRAERRAAELEIYANDERPAAGAVGAERVGVDVHGVQRAGQLLGKSRQMVVEMCQRGDLQHGRTDAGYYQIPRKAIREFVDNLGKTA